MQIITHKGTHQVGGTITEIRTNKARIIIDMGADLPSTENKAPKELAIEGVTTGEPDCDAVLITHYHGDHIGLIDKVLPGIPIYMGEVAKKIHLTVQQTVKDKIGTGNPELVETLKTFQPGERIYFKDIGIMPLCIDHSAFDAYALLIEIRFKRILHTGDFRMHGARGKAMPRVFKTYAHSLDVLITEGTMLSRPGEKVMTQHEMTAKAKAILKENKNTFVLCSSTNIDSIASFYNAAIECKRPFIVCDQMQADILKTVTENSKSSFYDFTRQKVYTYNSANKKLNDYMRDAGFCMMVRANYNSKQAIKAFSDGMLVYSMWTGYLDKRRPAFDEHKSNFIDEARLAGAKFTELHTSGHATAEDIVQLCEIGKPKVVIPIHSEDPQAFTKLGIKSKIVILNDGESFELEIKKTAHEMMAERLAKKRADAEQWQKDATNRQQMGTADCRKTI